MNNISTAQISEAKPDLSLSNFQAAQEISSKKSNQKIAYMMSRFPKLTETFILFEMVAMQQIGVQVELYPLLREKTTQYHPEAEEFIQRAHYQPFFSWPILKAHFYYLFRKPHAYFGTLWTLLRSTWGSMNYFLGGLGIFPKSVYFARLMSADGIEHIHAHFSSHPAASAYIIHKLTGIPYSFVAHGSDLHRDRHMLREKVSEAKFVAAISRFNQKIILSECGEKFKDKVIVLHCGVDTRFFHRREPNQASENNSRPFMILCIGTLHEVKGQTYLIKACQRLDQDGKNFQCHFIGDGPDKQALLQQVTQAGLEQKVFFHGQLTRTAVGDFLQQADVLVTPSVPSQDGRKEGIPVVLMEAMSCGVPAIASDLSGIPELVEHETTGLLFPPGDDLALSKALESLYNDPLLRQRLGEAGIAKIEQEFNLHRNAATLAALC
jgi:glycosyltransferase involved in cell wall biosynthesis